MDFGPIPGGQRAKRRRVRRRPRYKGPSFNRMVPNIMTLLGLCAGLTSIRYALDARWQAAALAIVIAAVIDGLDGRLARLLHAESRFGAEFDSLADFCSFGVAPAFILYIWSLHGTNRFAFMPCLMFAVCMALRLARFNAALETSPKPAYAQSFFTGVPAPAGAGVVLLPLFLWLEAVEQGWVRMAEWAQHPGFVACMLIGTSVLLVSTLPVWSFKNFKVPAEYVLGLLLGVGFFAALLVADPWLALAAAGLIYVTMLPFSVRSFHRLRAEAEDYQGEQA